MVLNAKVSENRPDIDMECMNDWNEGKGGVYVVFNGKEIDTARRHNLPLVTVIANDRQWGIVARIQRLAHGESFYGLGSKLSDKVRYDKYGEAFDCYGEMVRP